MSRSDDDDWQIEAVDGAPTAEPPRPRGQASRLWEAISACRHGSTVVVLHGIDGQGPRRSAPRQASAVDGANTVPGVEGLRR
jgi:hypothetical protein